LLGVVLLAAVFLILSPFTLANIVACDSYGQDWSINFGTFGSTFPGTSIVTGCRDCNASLGCGGALPLDGAYTAVVANNKIFSTTAYRAAGSNSCVSTHWTGLRTPHSVFVNGNVSNEFGPFGSFTITLNSNCGAAHGRSPVDPTTGSNGRSVAWPRE